MPVSLYIVFGKADDVAESLKEAAKRPWTAPKSAGPGDVALFYFGGSGRGIYAVGRTATRAEPGVPDNWTASAKGFFGRHKNIVALDSPVYHAQLRRTFPKWKRWAKLFGVRVHIVPLEYRERLGELIAAKNPTARALLAPWLSAGKEAAGSVSVSLPLSPDEEPWAFEGLRTEMVTYKHGRNRALRDGALAKSRGICEACAVDYSVLLDGKGVRVLELHHRKQLAATDRPQLTRLSDLAVVCANCHRLIHMNPKRALSVDRLRTILSKPKRNFAFELPGGD